MARAALRRTSEHGAHCGDAAAPCAGMVASLLIGTPEPRLTPEDGESRAKLGQGVRCRCGHPRRVRAARQRDVASLPPSGPGSAVPRWASFQSPGLSLWGEKKIITVCSLICAPISIRPRRSSPGDAALELRNPHRPLFPGTGHPAQHRGSLWPCGHAPPVLPSCGSAVQAQSALRSSASTGWGLHNEEPRARPSWLQPRWAQPGTLRAHRGSAGKGSLQAASPPSPLPPSPRRTPAPPAHCREI